MEKQEEYILITNGKDSIKLVNENAVQCLKMGYELLNEDDDISLNISSFNIEYYFHNVCDYLDEVLFYYEDNVKDYFDEFGNKHIYEGTLKKDNVKLYRIEENENYITELEKIRKKNIMEYNKKAKRYADFLKEKIMLLEERIEEYQNNENKEDELVIRIKKSIILGVKALNNTLP